MSKKVLPKMFQRECEALNEYQQEESSDTLNETECVTMSRSVPLNLLSPVTTCGNQLDGASSVSALEPVMEELVQHESCNVLDYRCIQNTSKEPFCHLWEKRSLGPATTSGAGQEPSTLQNASEDLSSVQGDLFVSENIPLGSNTALESIAGPSRTQNTFEEASIAYQEGFLNSAKDINAVTPFPGINMHLRRYPEKKKFSCDLCGEEYDTISELCDHYQNHISGKGFVCDVCLKEFHQKERLKMHYRTHFARFRLNQTFPKQDLIGMNM